jgi:hypothetical protein
MVPVVLAAPLLNGEHNERQFLHLGMCVVLSLTQITLMSFDTHLEFEFIYFMIQGNKATEL